MQNTGDDGQLHADPALLRILHNRSSQLAAVAPQFCDFVTFRCSFFRRSRVS